MPKYRRQRRRNNNGNSMLKTAFNMGKLALSMLNTETKVIDREDSTDATDSGTLFHLNPLAQGVTSETRVGASIRMKNIFIRYRVSYNVSGDNNQAVRVIVFVDKQSNGSITTVTDLLETADYLSPLDHLQGKRFHVLCDEMHSLYAGGNGIYNKCFIDLEQTEQTKALGHVEYKGTAGTIADVNTNAVYILFISSQATANYPAYDVYSRIKYIDN